jgi:hypothetical protein
MQTDLINSLSEKNKAPEKRTTHQVWIKALSNCWPLFSVSI